jgi:hypothetical protein
MDISISAEVVTILCITLIVLIGAFYGQSQPFLLQVMSKLRGMTDIFKKDSSNASEREED